MRYLILLAALAMYGPASTQELTRGAHYLLVFSCSAPIDVAPTTDCLVHTPPVTYSSSHTCELARAELERRLSSDDASHHVLCMTVLAE